ncbi:MAG: endoglucanase, partial [Candidatus Dormibacteraeota bacterium]|nr:endoglucanase [Candidatus Dormibacteraeota bacterium]
LIPRLKGWIGAGYPGTKLAVTEYNFGGEWDASGAVALAEALGAFGRLGVDLATYWTYPPPESPAGAAFRLFRDYDGRGATFGDISLPVSSGQPAVAAFAARHSDSGEIDVILANESQTGTAQVRLEEGGRPAAGTPYCVAAGSSRIVRGAAVPAGASVAVGRLGLCMVRLEAV